MINLQIESRYKEFFGLVCLHSYYSDKVTRDLEFEPTPETAQQLKNFQLVFKSLPFGFLVLYNPAFSASSLLLAAKKMRFSFRIVNRNQRFMNFSRIPFWPEGTIFHYSNASLRKTDIPVDFEGELYYYFKELKVAEVQKKLLHLPQHNLISKRSRKFSINMEGAGKPGDRVSFDDVAIRDEMGEEFLDDGVPYKKPFSQVNRNEFRAHLSHAQRQLNTENLSSGEIEKRLIEIREDLERKMSAEPRSDIAVDMMHAPSGRYPIQFGDLGTMDCYLTDYPSERLFGYLDIYLDTQEDALLNRDAKDPEDLIQPQLFSIHYEARQTYWRYFFLNYKNSKVKPTLIRDENNEISFTEPQEGFLQSVGSPAMIAESVEPLALHDRPQYQLILERMNGKRKMKDLRLPLPDWDKVKPVRSAEGQEKIYSDILVYL